MKPNQRKWEELLEDPSLEKRILNQTQNRYHREKNRNRRIASVSFVVLLLTGILTYTNYISPTDDLTNDVSMLLEELDSNPFLYLGGD